MRFNLTSLCLTVAAVAALDGSSALARVPNPNSAATLATGALITTDLFGATTATLTSLDTTASALSTFGLTLAADLPSRVLNETDQGLVSKSGIVKFGSDENEFALPAPQVAGLLLLAFGLVAHRYRSQIA